MSHPSGLSFVTSHIALNGGNIWISNPVLTASEWGAGYYHDQVSGEGQRRIQLDQWNLQTSTGFW